MNAIHLVAIFSFKIFTSTVSYRDRDREIIFFIYINAQDIKKKKSMQTCNFRVLLETRILLSDTNACVLFTLIDIIFYRIVFNRSAVSYIPSFYFDQILTTASK